MRLGGWASLAIILAVLLGACGESSSSGQSTERITYAKYQQIQTGMSYQQVCNILGSSGRELARNKLEGVEGYTEDITTIAYGWQNPDGSNMNAIFQNGKLVSKAQAGLK